MSIEEIKSLIESGLSTSLVNVIGDGTHFEAVIVSSDFENKILIDRHKLVYKALGDAMVEDIHAISLKTYTPDQWQNLQQKGA
ncbi:MAG: BolA family protein [Thermodesulfobacteriota bacterium]